MPDETAAQILEAARKQFDAAEVYEEAREKVTVAFDDNRLREIRTEQRRGVGLRVINGGRIGFASSTDLREPERLVEMARASAAFGDRATFEMPDMPAELPCPDLYEEDMEDVSAEQMVEMGRQGLDLSGQADDGYLFSCHLSRTLHRQHLLNSAGLDFEYRATRMSADVEIQEVGENGLLQVYEWRTWGRPFDTVVDLTRTALDKMRDASTIAEAKLQAMPMIFTPKAFGNLAMPLAVALNGKNVHKGSSVLRGRIGEQILDERLSITDDPTVSFAPGSCPMDDEGVPARRRAIFEDGVLCSHLADLQTAGLLGIEPTGHGFRSYSSRPSPSSTNTVVAAGDATLDEMLAGIERGLIIDQTLGSGQSNLLAGEFSVNVALGFLVENGTVQGRVKDCMVAGNVYEVLNRVEAIGSERQWLGSTCAPPIMVGGLKLAAQG
ncbi:MAG: TldD/PmbA family protein [Candidatus Brocadiia bacterium]